MNMVLSYIKLLRPHQYIKNGFVLIGVTFAGQWNAPILMNAGLVFLAFCLVASAVYLFNDIVDIESDRQHPVKKNRPLAARRISVKVAGFISFALVILGLAVAHAVSLWAFVFISVYILINLGYSWRFKHVVVLDVFFISAGFMLRILAGTIGLGIPPSSWLLLCGLALTLFLGFAKRRAELLALERADITDRTLTRKVLDDYSPTIIEQFMSISAACTIMCYSLYTVSAETLERHHGTRALIYTVPFVIYGVFRYLFLLHQRDSGNDIASDLYSDRHLLITVFLWVVITFIILAKPL